MTTTTESTSTEKTLFIVKPDAVSRNLTGSIIARFEQKGFRITHLKMFQFTKQQAEQFYKVHSEKPFFGELVSFICSGPVVAAVIEGGHAVPAVRTMIGATKSFEASRAPYAATTVWDSRTTSYTRRTRGRVSSTNRGWSLVGDAVRRQPRRKDSRPQREGPYASP